MDSWEQRELKSLKGDSNKDNDFNDKERPNKAKIRLFLENLSVSLKLLYYSFFS